MLKKLLLLVVGIVLVAQAVSAVPYSISNSSYASNFTHIWTMDVVANGNVTDVLKTTNLSVVGTITQEKANYCKVDNCTQSAGDFALRNAVNGIYNGQPEKTGFAFWAKFNSTTVGIDPYIIGTTDDYQWDIGISNSGTPDVWQFSLRGTPSSCVIYSLRNFDTSWHHWQVGYDNSTKNMTLWQDGVRINSTICSGFSPTASASNTVALFNHMSGAGDQMLGYIDDFGVYNGMPTDCMALQLYNGSSCGPPVASNVTISAINGFNSTSILRFNVTLTDGSQNLSYTTTTGTVTTGVLTNSTSFWNITVVTNEDANHWNATRYNVNVSSGTVSLTLAQYPFIMLSDYYNGATLTGFSGTILGVTYNTTTPQLFIPINTSSTTAVSLSKSTYIGRDVSLVLVANGNQNSSLWQYQLNVSALDVVSGESISSFTFTIPLFSGVGNSSVALPVRVAAGSYVANLTATGYQNASYSFTATAGDSANVNIYLNPFMTFNLLREANGAAFNVNLTQQTIMTVVCENTSLQYTFTSSSASIPINCSWTFMKMDVIYNDSSYYRTLIPASTERTVTWYLLDLTTDLAVQIILQLNDLTGQFLDGYATLKKAIGGSEQDVLVQFWDVENQVTSYLITNGLYTLSITAPDGTVRSIGYLVADAAGTKTITVPDIAFVPDQGVGGSINWDWNDNGDSAIRLQYNDTSSTRTSSLLFTVYNGSNVASQLYTTTQTNVGYVSLSYAISNTSSYLACFNATHSTYGSIYECKTYQGSTSLWDTSDWDSEEADKIKGWFSIIFLVVIFLAIVAIDEVAALAMVTVFMWIFMNWNWLTFGNVYLDYMILSLFGLITGLTFFWRGGLR